jgi:hypothetical protein
MAARRNKLAAAVHELTEAAGAGDEAEVAAAVGHLAAVCCEKGVIGGGGAKAARGAAVEADDLRECEAAVRAAMGDGPAADGQPVPAKGLLDGRPLLRAALLFALEMLAKLMASDPPAA